MTRLLYTIVIIALLPWAVLHLLWRAYRQPDYLKHWQERFGRFRPRPPGPLIWLHAVSVGETRAAQPLIAALAERYPQHRILITHMTPTGRATAQALFSTQVTQCYLPYDLPWAMRHFLRHYRPDIGLVMETELWPNLIAACEKQNVPLLLVNARLSERSARRYARVARLTRQSLQRLSAIAAIGSEDARRLKSLGARQVQVFGNMKFDIAPPQAQLNLGREFRARIGSRPFFLCASTREGEEAAILAAWQKLAAHETALLGIVPRHPQRFEEVARLIEAQGLTLQRRSDEQSVACNTQVWLGDSLGELFAYYAAADVCFIGGSLLDYGCQNLIEACAVGTPLLIGTSTFNFRDAARDALAAGAAVQVSDAQELVTTALRLMGDTSLRQTMAEAGRAFAARHRGATERTLELIAQFIPAAR